MKKAIMIIVVMLVILLGVYQGVLAETQSTGTVICSRLNLREQPNIHSDVSAVLARGEKVLIKSELDGWYSVVYEDYSGYVCAQYVSVIGDRISLGAVNGSSVNIREFPDITSSIIDRLNKGEKVRVTEENNGWYRIRFRDDKNGWIFGRYLTIIGEPVTTAFVKSSEVNIRVNPGLNSEIVTMLDKWEKVSVYGVSGEWYLVETKEGEFGWIYNSLIHIEESSISRGIGDDIFFRDINLYEVASVQYQIVEYARESLGVRYVWGGSTPKGFDCSGFVLYIYREFGVNLPHLASMQARLGSYVKKSQLCAGDLVFFDTDGGHNDITHVGIYMGDDNFIHASSSSSNGKKVTQSDLTGFYERSYMTARRILN